MNKSLITNLLACLILVAGIYLNDSTIKTIGLFALSGAVTNWLAVHMLFERVPGLYGSGVIPQHFEELKSAIRHLMMTQFFHEENITRFLSGSDDPSAGGVDLEPVIREMDLSPMFDSLVKTIEESSFGSMLAMIGGAQGLEALKQPFIKRMQDTLVSVSQTDQVQQAVRTAGQGVAGSDAIKEKITTIIDQRLNELTPALVKKIIQDIIRAHLGWLVVWGGVFGALIGFVSTRVF